MKIEYWTAVIGFEGLYEVSSYGRVRSVDKNIISRWGTPFFKKGAVLKPQKDKYGYLYVNLYKNGNLKHSTIHRLVAEAFIPNPNNLPCVNHKSENKEENFVENLEWCDNTYNLNYGKRKEKAAKSRYKKVYQYDLEGNFIKEWDSLKEIPYNKGNISMCCNGKIKTAYGYIWKHKKDAA